MAEVSRKSGKAKTVPAVPLATALSSYQLQKDTWLIGLRDF